MMVRKISISLLVAAVAVLVFAVAVSAQGQGFGLGPNGDNPGAGQMSVRGWHQRDGGVNMTGMMNHTMQSSAAQNRNDACVNFVDEDGDGICDNAGQQLGMGHMMGRGMASGAGTGVGLGVNGTPQHQHGDGECDLGTPPRDGTGSQYGQE
ncbi:MAG: hypothetical protein R2932_41265 [Caldilineaceae bacterium]